MKLKFRKIKIAAVLMCAAMIGGSFTYVNNSGSADVMAKTVSDLENEKASNDKKIAELEQQMNDIDDDIANEKYKQSLIQEKLDAQTENLNIISEKIDDLNKKIDKSQTKIKELKKDIKKKQADIEVGKEQFKLRLRAMYVYGNDSLASALVGATDFYDALSKMELISQVSKHDNDLVESLKTQLEQYEEAKTQLDIKTDELNQELSEQKQCQKEFKDAIDSLNAEYQESQDFIDIQLSKKQAASDNIDQYEADNAAMDQEIQKINTIAAQQAQSYSNSEDDDDDDYYDDSDNSGSSGSSDSGSSDTPDYNDGPDYSNGGSLSWPVPGHYVISSGYGSRWGSFHAGIDISDGATMGAAVTAAAGGTVSYVATGCSHNYGKDSSCGCNGGYGNYLLIDHGNGMTTLYAHLGSVNVSQGQYVSAGEMVGVAGSTGWSTGAHLHFEVRINGSTVDPQGYL